MKPTPAFVPFIPLDQYHILCARLPKERNPTPFIRELFKLSDNAKAVQFLNDLYAKIKKARKNTCAESARNQSLALAESKNAKVYLTDAATHAAKAKRHQKLHVLYDHAAQDDYYNIGWMYQIGVLSEPAFEALCAADVVGTEAKGNLMIAYARGLCDADFSKLSEQTQQEIAKVFIAFGMPNYSLLLSPAMIKQKSDGELVTQRSVIKLVMQDFRANGKITEAQHRAIITGKVLKKADRANVTKQLTDGGVSERVIKNLLQKHPKGYRP